MDITHAERSVLNLLHRRPDTAVGTLTEEARPVAMSLLERGLIHEADPANKWSRVLSGLCVRVADETMLAILSSRAWEADDFKPDFLGVEADAWFCHHLLGKRVHASLVDDEFVSSLRGKPVKSLMVLAGEPADERFFVLDGPSEMGKPLESAGYAGSPSHFHPTLNNEHAETAMVLVAKRYGVSASILLNPVGEGCGHRRGASFSRGRRSHTVSSGGNPMSISTFGVRVCMAARKAILDGMLVPSTGEPPPWPATPSGDNSTGGTNDQ